MGQFLLRSTAELKACDAVVLVDQFGMPLHKLSCRTQAFREG